MEPEIIFEDNHLLVVVKPTGIPVQKTDSGKKDLQTLLKEFIKKRRDKSGNVFLGVVHRLDQPVGGVMIFAKTSKAASRLSEQARQREWKREYFAVVDGLPDKKSETLEDYLVKNSALKRVFVSKKGDPKAKRAEMSYEVVKKSGKRALIKILLGTGRSHQIRVQLASRNMPVVNDCKYNKKAKIGNDVALWAYSIEISHPITKEKMKFVKDFPKKMEELLLD